MSAARLKHYGWGREGEAMSEAERAFVLGRYIKKFGHERFETLAAPRLEDIALPEPRVTPFFLACRFLHGGALRSHRPYLRQVLRRLCPRPARPL